MLVLHLSVASSVMYQKLIIYYEGWGIKVKSNLIKAKELTKIQQSSSDQDFDHGIAIYVSTNSFVCTWQTLVIHAFNKWTLMILLHLAS